MGSHGTYDMVMNAYLTLSPLGIAAIHASEGCALQVYKDQHGLPTIGWGHLITPHDPALLWAQHGISQEEADAIFIRDTASAQQAVRHGVTVELNQNQFDALVSLTYNIGAASFLASSLLKFLNAGNMQDAAAQFLAWDKTHIDGVLRYSQGLYNRRLREKTLFLTTIAA